jgi:hypothetical protein
VSRMADPTRSSPWRNPMVWLVVGLPLSAVIAGFITLWIAAHGADPLVGSQAASRSSAPP